MRRVAYLTRFLTPLSRRLLLLILVAHIGIVTAQQTTVSSLDESVQQAQSAQAAGRYAEAAEAYRKATTAAPEIAELWANRGLMEHLSAQPALAIESFKHSLALKPALFTPILFTGVDYVDIGKPSLAVPYLKQARSLQPKNPEAALALAKAFASMHDSHHSAAEYEDALALAPQNASGWYGLAVASLMMIDEDGGALAFSHSDSVWAQMLYADDLLTQNRTSEAIDLYRRAGSKAPSRERATFLQMLEVSSKDQVTPSITADTLERLRATLQPNAAASTHLQSGSSSKQQSYASKDQPGYEFLQAHYSKSASAAAHLLEERPSSPELLYWSVKANERRAVNAFVRFEELSPQSPATFDLTGDLYRRRGLPEQARAEYAKAFAVDPHDPGALLGTASAHLSEGHLEQAISTASIGLSDHPSDPYLSLVAAEALIAQHNFSQARTYLQNTLTGPSATLPHVHALIGRVNAEEGKTDDAITELKLGLSSDRDGSLHYLLYRLYRKTGNMAAAQEAEAGARALQTKRLQYASTAVESTSPSNN